MMVRPPTTAPSDPNLSDPLHLPFGQRSVKCRRVHSGPIHLIPRRIGPLFLDELDRALRPKRAKIGSRLRAHSRR